jgi:hypothetical protein
MPDLSRNLHNGGQLLSRPAVFLLGVLLLAAPSVRAADPKSGAADFTGNKHLKVTIGKGLKLETDFHRFEFGGKTALAANGNVKNTSRKKLYGTLYIAFFDKEKNLVACSDRTTITLDAGKQTFVGSVLEIPLEQMNKIASYQVRIYEGEKEIGKK